MSGRVSNCFHASWPIMVDTKSGYNGDLFYSREGRNRLAQLLLPRTILGNGSLPGSNMSLSSRPVRTRVSTQDNLEPAVFTGHLDCFQHTSPSPFRLLHCLLQLFPSRQGIDGNYHRPAPCTGLVWAWLDGATSPRNSRQRNGVKYSRYGYGYVCFRLDQGSMDGTCPVQYRSPCFCL